MPVPAIKITLKGQQDVNHTVNNFKLLKNVEPIPLVNGDNWFYFEGFLDGFELGYLYLTHKMDIDLGWEIYRSSCYEGNDSSFAVLIPGGVQTVNKNFPEVTSADFNISLFGGDKIWMKIVAAGLPILGAQIDDLCFGVKR